MRADQQVLARYSFVKSGAWILVVAGVCGWILAVGLGNGWSPPPNTNLDGLYLLGYGAASFGLLGAAAMLAVLVLRRGVAIYASDSHLVLNFPFGRKRIYLDSSLVVSANARLVDHAVQGTHLAFKAGSARVPQITFSRAGEADITFESPLLSEDAKMIAARIAVVIANARTAD